MTFVKMPLKDAVPPEALPEGEYTLVIESVDEIEEPGKTPYLQIRHTVVGEPDASTVFHRLALALPDDKEKAKWSMLYIKAYLKAFGVEYKGTGYDPELVVPGLTATVKLGRREYQGLVSNEIKLNPQDVT